MAPNSRTIENPINGERVTFVTTAQETNGTYVKTAVELPPGSQGQPVEYGNYIRTSSSPHSVMGFAINPKVLQNV